MRRSEAISWLFCLASPRELVLCNSTFAWSQTLKCFAISAHKGKPAALLKRQGTERHGVGTGYRLDWPLPGLRLMERGVAGISELYWRFMNCQRLYYIRSIVVLDWNSFMIHSHITVDYSTRAFMSKLSRQQAHGERCRTQVVQSLIGTCRTLSRSPYLEEAASRIGWRAWNYGTLIQLYHALVGCKNIPRGLPRGLETLAGASFFKDSESDSCCSDIKWNGIHLHSISCQMPVLHKFDSGVSRVQRIPFGFPVINTFELLQAVERRLPLVGRCHQMIGPFWSKKNGVTGWVHWTVESGWESDIAVICALRCFCLLGPKGQIQKHRQVHDVWRWNPISDGHYHQRLLCDQFWQGLGRLKRVKGWRPRMSRPPS